MLLCIRLTFEDWGEESISLVYQDTTETEDEIVIEGVRESKEVPFLVEWVQKYWTPIPQESATPCKIYRKDKSKPVLILFASRPPPSRYTTQSPQYSQ